MSSRQRRKNEGNAKSSVAGRTSPSLVFYTTESLSSEQNGADDDGGDSNPSKRRLLDGAIDYPRRRATIAVSAFEMSDAGI